MAKSYKKKYTKKGGYKRKNTISNRKPQNKNREKKMTHYLDNSKKASIVKIFLEMIHMIKLYHWKTTSYAEHKATDELHERMSGHVDKFVEVLLGKDSSRVQMVVDKMDLLDMNNTKEIKIMIFKYIDFLVNMNAIFDEKIDSDLLNIRDEMLGDLNQFLYLLSLH
jgi:hypothetical protein